MDDKFKIKEDIKKELSAWIIPYKRRFLSGILDVLLLVFFIIFVRFLVDDVLGTAFALSLLILGFLWLFAQFYVTKGTTIMQSIFGMKVVFMDGRPLTLKDVNDMMWENCNRRGLCDTTAGGLTKKTDTNPHLDKHDDFIVISKKKWQAYINSQSYQSNIQQLNR